MQLPHHVAAALADEGPDGVVVVRERALHEGQGAATGAVVLLDVELSGPDGRKVEKTLIRKTVAPVTGRHAAGAANPRHWAYWRREAEAYDSDLLPQGPGLRSPRCGGVVGDMIYLEMLEGMPASVQQAAEHLARWQVKYDAALDRPWLATDQIGQRLSVTSLEWSGVDVEPRVVRLWNRREELLEELRRLPSALSHGDYNLGNLVDVQGDTVAVDWATLGWEPVGFDLAHLALSTGIDPTEPYASASRRFDAADIRAGYRAALVIVGISRLHWMMSAGYPVPSWHLDLVLGG